MGTDIYWVSGLRVGGLAIMPRPRGGDWLDSEIQHWHQAQLHTVVSALEPAEVYELDLRQEAPSCIAAGIAFISFPIVDRNVPSSFRSTAQLVQGLMTTLESGHRIGIHCRAGIGRSSLLAACVLTQLGHPVQQAFAMLTQARKVQVPDTPEQIAWVSAFTKQVQPAAQVKSPTENSLSALTRNLASKFS